MRIILVVGLLWFLAGCTSAPASSPPAEEPGRDREAVLSALRPIDPCALLPGEDERSWTSPYQCATVGPRRLVVIVGKWLDPERVTGERIEVAGVRAMRRSMDRSCAVDLLVGADLSVRFDAVSTRPAGALCEMAMAAATEGVALLAEPENLAGPGPHQDACELLRRAAGDRRLADLPLRFGQASLYGLDECQARREDDNGWRAEYAVHLVHGKLGSLSNERPDTLSGRPVMIYETGETCEYSWRAAPTSQPTRYGDRIVRTMAPDCAEAAELARTLMETDTDPSPSVDPQRPLLTPA